MTAYLLIRVRGTVNVTGKIQDTLTLEKPDFTPAAGADRPRTRIRGAH